MYICYFGIMSLQSIIIFVYCLLLEFMFATGCLAIFTMMAQEHWLAPIAYFTQLYTYGYGGYILFGKLRAFRNRDPRKDSLISEDIEAIEEKDTHKKNKKSKYSKNNGDEEVGKSAVPSPNDVQN